MTQSQALMRTVLASDFRSPADVRRLFLNLAQ
jgi:hypothetical protein